MKFNIVGLATHITGRKKPPFLRKTDEEVEIVVDIDMDLGIPRAYSVVVFRETKYLLTAVRTAGLNSGTLVISILIEVATATENNPKRKFLELFTSQAYDCPYGPGVIKKLVHDLSKTKGGWRVRQWIPK